MQDTGTLTSPPPMAPLPLRERIEAMDVVRGFALIGICLMNLDFFNRSVLLVGTGMAPGLTGIDYAAAFFVSYFISSKFWTIFALLFGMGFAVMLTRAETGGRDFFKPYLRRIAALAVFGAVHHIFFWGGDILFSYAVGALFLLLTLYGNWKLMLAGVVAFAGLAAIPGMSEQAGPAIPAIILSGLLALYLRNDRRYFSLPLLSLILLALAFICALVAGVTLLTDAIPAGARIPLLAAAAALALLGTLVRKYQHPASARPLRAGVTIWVLVFGVMAAVMAVDYLSPKKAEAPAAAVTASANKAPLSAEAKKAADEAAKHKAESAKARAKHVADIANDTRIVSTGTYAEGVVHRAKQFLERPGREAGMSGILVAMFLIGAWFIRSGIMANTGAHLPMFRKLAMFGIPVGVGLGLLGSLIATSHTPGTEGNGYMLAQSMLMLGSLPASLGYASMAILMLHSTSWMSKIRVLAPFGRMALTNYLMQTVVCSMFFYGWGLGNWGMGRATQLVFALALCALQIVLSRIWLRRFRYGPLEWLWRAVTYMKLPEMRIDRAPSGVQLQPN